MQAASRIPRFLHSDTAAGLLLLLAATLALIISNTSLAPAYFAALEAKLGPLSLLHWVNDGLMALFFLLMGLEIKREFAGGALSTPASRILPMLAAAGGMLAPALLFLLLARDAPDLHRGWAIPTATDIAFAVGVLALLGKRVPPTLRLFLVTLAIVDDMGAILIIAIAYTGSLNLPALAGGAVLVGGLFLLNRLGVRRLFPYLAIGSLLWLLTHLSGIHATVAGVLVAAFIPATPAGHSPLHRLAAWLSPWTNFGIIPLFGLANAGISFANVPLSALFAPLPLAIAVGLFLGKQAGVFSTVWLLVRFKLAQQPAGASWVQIYGVAVLCGIGFTMSLFIGTLAFNDPLLLEEVKIGVFSGSLLSALAGTAVLRLATR